MKYNQYTIVWHHGFMQKELWLMKKDTKNLK